MHVVIEMCYIFVYRFVYAALKGKRECKIKFKDLPLKESKHSQVVEIVRKGRAGQSL